ncbi:MutS-related protein [Lapillicoccus sp.]|uniref:MutS-related protein n=1 Tax=Lapillicoccus sp. TaxID=1909287 RepID=UPI003266F20F
MKVHLLHAAADPATAGKLPSSNEALVRDLGLDTLFARMAKGDQFVRDVVTRTILTPLLSPADIEWRQAVLRDCLRHPEAARALYDLAVDGVASPKKVRGWLLGRSVSAILSHSIETLEVLVGPLRTVRCFADEHVDTFGSQGLTDLLEAVRHDLSDDYFTVLSEHLDRLHFPTGVVITADLGKGGKGTHLVLRKPTSFKRSWRDLLGLGRPGEYTYRVPDRDEAGFQALSDLRDRGTVLVADALAQSTDHILSFFELLRWEMAFYIGALNLYEELAAHGLPVAFPHARPPGGRQLNTTGLYDVCLGLRSGATVIGNDLDADAMSLLMITGVNQGGKSTMLRSIGLAQVMMQSGLFVAATAFRADTAGRVHTHFAREEDASMQSGKLDEELARMSEIVDQVEPGDLVLFNESFASTNEREGSRIARGIVDGLTEADVRVVYVTHMYDLAQTLAAQHRPDALFLRPERLEDGRRTFKVLPGDPLPTSYGRDVFEKVFGSA